MKRDAKGAKRWVVKLGTGILTNASGQIDIPQIEQLTAQICVVSGGPCKYEGATMPKAHLDMHITRADFNAVVEILQDAMDARGIPFAEQNRLLARLAPMHREIEGR